MKTLQSVSHFGKFQIPDMSTNPKVKINSIIEHWDVNLPMY